MAQLLDGLDVVYAAEEPAESSSADDGLDVVYAAEEPAESRSAELDAARADLAAAAATAGALEAEARGSG